MKLTLDDLRLTDDEVDAIIDQAERARARWSIRTAQVHKTAWAIYDWAASEWDNEYLAEGNRVTDRLRGRADVLSSLLEALTAALGLRPEDAEDASDHR